MTSHAFLSLSLSAMFVGAVTAGCAADGSSRALASASTHGDAAANRAAADAARKADEALARHHPDEAVRFAEAAVAWRPRQAALRLLLGRSYLKAGRFTSARQAFADALALEPNNGKAALNLALAQIGTGDWAGARRTLDLHESDVPAADRGLALALAGDPATGAELLMGAARTPEADVTTRQNLALALALAGRWWESRAVAAVDLSPADVDRRMTEWAAFVQPTSASDQIAALLGVVPVVDGGQPVALALVTPAPTVAKPVQAAMAAPLAATRTLSEPVAMVAATEPVGPAPVRVAPATLAPASASPNPVRFAPASLARPSVRRDFVVQLGIYDNAAIAHDGWSHIARRNPTLAMHVPMGAAFSNRSGSFYRLSVGMFSRGEATAACRRYMARGGGCYVRAAAGDQLAAWVRSGRIGLTAR